MTAGNLVQGPDVPGPVSEQPGASPVTDTGAEVADPGGIEIDLTNAEPTVGRTHLETTRRTIVREEAVSSEAAENASAPAHASSGGGTHEHSPGPRDQLSFHELQAIVRMGARPAGYLGFAGSLVIPRADETLALTQTGLTDGLVPRAPHHIENSERLVQAMRVMVKDGVSEATVRLRPDHLGEVRIEVRVEGKSVTATVNAESPAVREWLRLNEDTLRSGLSQQGLTLDRLLVQRDPRQERREQPKQGLPRSRSGREREPQPRFEVSA